MDERYGAPVPPPSSLPPQAAHDYTRGPGPVSPPRGSRFRSPSPRRHRSPSPRRYRSRSPPRGGYRSRSPPRRFNDAGPPRRRAPAPIYRGTEEERARSTTLFVGNIPYGFEERDVVGLFERFGRLRQVHVPLDRFTRRNKGFAFVEFEQRLDAEDASFKYNGYELEGRKLRIDWDVGMEKKTHLRGEPKDYGRRDYPPRRDYPARSPRRDYPPASPRRDYPPISPRRDYPPASPRRDYPPLSPRREPRDDFPPRRDRSPAPYYP